MNTEALIVISVITLVLGVIFLVPGLWWARRRAKKLPENSPGRKKVTLLGFAYYTIFITLLMLAFSLIHLAPELSWVQLIAIQATVVVVGIAVEIIAYKLGFRFVE